MTSQRQGIRVSRGGAPVTDAVVTVNGVSLTYCCGDLYTGNLAEAVPVGGTLDLEVVAGGVTFEATGEVMAPPTITAPVVGSVIASNDSMTVAWSTPTDPDQFELILNCENCNDGVAYYASGSEREVKVGPRSLADYGEGALIVVYATKNHFVKSADSADVTADVRFMARSPDLRVAVKY